LTPSKAAGAQAAPLEALAGTAQAEVVSAQLLGKLLAAMDDPHATLHLRFRGEALTALTHRLEKTAGD